MIHINYIYTFIHFKNVNSMDPHQVYNFELFSSAMTIMTSVIVL